MERQKETGREETEREGRRERQRSIVELTILLLMVKRLTSSLSFCCSSENAIILSLNKNAACFTVFA